ncbi:apolipoprotein D [Fopius arisanus]|uniref:APOD_2 protein n=1 Tax=Fopius arisanus TaxID=64838 RepID=A0A0C9R4U6_9HYME|nr:PREDICTED: apolipoprotein D-like [Fopius arisanus]
MLKQFLLVLSALALAGAQVPSLGWCPEYVPMANFDIAKFLGVWYEAERYFQLSEVVSRCVMANYTRGNDGKLRVSNEVTNRFTGIKRVLEGEIKPSASKAEEGKLHVKYTTVPLTPETSYAVLETDYKNYAVLWSCTGIGPVNAQNAWLMTRQRRPVGEILQKAYGVLDKYKISKTFFVKTDQNDCAYLDSPPPVETTIEEQNQADHVEEVSEGENLRSAIIPDAPEIIIQTRKAELAEQAKESKLEVVKEPAEHLKAETIKEEPVLTEVVKEESKPETVPEVILKTAEIKESTPAKEQPVKQPVKQPVNQPEPVEQAQNAEPVLSEPENLQAADQSTELPKEPQKIIEAKS